MSGPGEPGSSFVPSRLRAFVIVIGLLGPAVSASATQAPTVTSAPVAVPPEVAPAVAASLGGDVVTVTAGSTKLEFWWVKALALRESASSTPSWADVPDGAMAGVLRLSAAWTEIRGYTIRPGVYTLRFALQPQNGDHMGISPHREFLLPGLAAEDTAVSPVGYDGAVALAKKASRRAHPASISIDPPVATAAPLSTTTTDLGHQVVVMSVPTSAGTPLTFGLVVEGTIEH
jgi:hypothetical protein